MQNTDVIIIGAGLTGMTMACLLAGQGIAVTVIESGDIGQIRAKESDGRTSAISHGSAKIFTEIGVWKAMEKHGGPILDIRVTDDESPLFLHYDHKLVGNEPMGHIIENYHIREALFNKAARLENIHIIDKTSYASMEYGTSDVKIILTNGDELCAPLLIAADGRNSRVRQESGIMSAEWKYDQCGIVCTVKHEKEHGRVAQERFLPAGPFAILPMHDAHHSSIVWTEKADIAYIFMRMDNAEFLENLNERFGNYLGKLEVAGNRFLYPLSLLLARNYSAKRLALIGDAAHAIHPIAGQGFNLGIRDVPVLAKLIKKQKELGLDIGAASILAEYDKIRKYDNITMIAVTDGLNRLFSNNILPVKLARRFGMAAVNRINPLKKAFIKHAMGMKNNGEPLNL